LTKSKTETIIHKLQVLNINGIYKLETVKLMAKISSVSLLVFCNDT